MFSQKINRNTSAKLLCWGLVYRLSFFSWFVNNTAIVERKCLNMLIRLTNVI